MSKESIGEQARRQAQAAWHYAQRHAPAWHPSKTGWLIIAAVGLAFVVGLYFLLRPREAPVQRPIVGVEMVGMSNVNIYGEYVGRIRAQQFVEIRARVEGYLEKMLFEEGGHIDRGQTLFLIDPTVYRANLEKARANLNKAKAQEVKADRDLQRIEPLFKRNAASQLDLDNAQAAYDMAKAEVIVKQADLTQAQLTLSYTQVTSPIAGYISERNVDIGTLVGPGAKSLLATVVKTDTVLVDFSMTSLDYLRSRERNVRFGNGQTDSTRKWNSFVTVTLADGKRYPYEGVVDFADPQVNPTTGTFSVRAEMPNPEHVLMPGEYTKVRVLVDVRENACQVPNKAVVIDKSGNYIFVVLDDNTVERRFVELGPELGNYVVVERGLTAGERVVVEGYHKLEHGMSVECVVADDDEL